MLSFSREWQSFYGKTHPIAFMLRGVAGKPWVRFHALPGSVRYAQTKQQQDEIHRRAAILANETLGRGSECWLVRSWREEYPKPVNSSADCELRYREDDDDFQWVSSPSQVLWHEDTFRDLLHDIAEDRTGPTLWFNGETGKVFAPYDGGFDLFPTSIEEVDELKRQHGDWLSSEPSGL